jgi:hypothetical protein
MISTTVREECLEVMLPCLRPILTDAKYLDLEFDQLTSLDQLRRPQVIRAAPWAEFVFSRHGFRHVGAQVLDRQAY